MYSNKHFRRWAVLICLVVMTTLAAAQLPMPVSTQFDITGFLQEATLATPGDAHSGGTLRVNGHLVTVPRETIVILPANALTWAELFTKAPVPYTGSATGMAMSDIPQPLTTYEVHVVGNRVTNAAGGDQYIAGLIDIAQNGLNSGGGFINYIDYVLGEIRVGGAINDPTTGTRVRINDPMGRYGRATTSPDVRFTVDPDNPTIMSGTGYPMCLPRTTPLGPNDFTSDPLCPQMNRPQTVLPDGTVGFVSSFTMNNLSNVAAGPTTTAFPNSTFQAPMEVGDYVTFSGTLVQDCAVGPTCPAGGTTAGPWPAAGAAATWISAHTINSNVAIYTFPGSNPAYVMTEVTIIGTGGLTVLGAGEAAIRTRFEGMSTDPTRGIHLYGIDLDPLTGNSSDRDWGTIMPDPGPPVGAVTGRWRFRPPCLSFGTVPTKPDKQCVYGPSGQFLPPTREMRAVIEGLQSQNPSSGIAVQSANQLFYGQYHAPILEYIFPENVPGSPIVANNFEAIPFLAQGGYSSSGIPDGVSTLAGQLNPWPGAVAPATNLPVAPSAVAIQANPNPVASGGVVTLSASANGTAPMTFTWSAASGTLSSTTGSSVSWTAPPNATAAAISSLISVTASNGTAPDASGSVTITVNPAPQLTASITPAAPQTVASGTPVSYTGGCTGGVQPCTFQWSATPALTFSPNAASANVSVTPVLLLGTLAPVTYTVQLVATDAAGGTSTVTATLTVNPPADAVSITAGGTEYRTGKQRLTISATSSIINPGVVLALQPYLTEGGTIYDPSPSAGGVGNLFTNNGGGLYTIVLVGAPRPACNLGGTYATPCSQKPLVVKSNLGGTSPAAGLDRIRN